ncbi:Beta-glucosidase 1 [Arabidopsis thaliana]
MEDVLTLITMIVLLLLASPGFGKCSSDLYSRSDFPEGFVFGAGISAYQEDVQLMAETGLHTFRFSISWSRLISSKQMNQDLELHNKDTPRIEYLDAYIGAVLKAVRNDFPEGFAFGAGISAYQWEGAVDEDGRKPSVWDTFLHSRKKDNGDIACDGYHKYKEDVQLMAETGLHAFRFSISWSRLISNGRGSINPKGLQFYKNFIQELVKHGIEPHVTLHHYDHPQYLEDDYGGWTNRQIIKDFTAYADVCFREFGNHVKFWTTINEANIFTIGGYNDGNSPPGRCSFPGRNCTLGNSSTETYIVGHNLLLAHASVSRLYKQKYKDIQGGSVGFSLFAMNFTPSTNSKDDEIATKRANDFYLGWMLEPLIYGDYPDVMKRTIGSRLPVFSKEESEQVKGSSDFIGVIHYLTALVTNIDGNPSLSGIPDFNSDMGESINILSMRVRISRLPNSDEKCLIFFIKLKGILEYIKQSYGNPPVYILENGKTMNQDLELQQKDTPRIEYLDAYIGAVLKAVRNGSDTRGYFVWSFMDLYELLNGYKSSFGLYSVNFSDPHLKRSPKLSAHWYSGFLKGKTTFLGSQGITQLHSNFSSSR